MRKCSAGINFIKAGDEGGLLTGTITADFFKGGDGDDVFFGREGNDTARGGDGDDQLVGEYDTPRASIVYGNDLLTGGDGNDALFGDSKGWRPPAQFGGADTLIGGDGDDSLYGDTDLPPVLGLSQGGDDLLIGGDGNDVYYFRGEFGDDTIYGYEQGEDILTVMGGFAENGGHVSFLLTIDEVAVEVVGGDTLLVLDGTYGSAGTVRLVGFTGTLTQGDFYS